MTLIVQTRLVSQTAFDLKLSSRKVFFYSVRHVSVASSLRDPMMMVPIFVFTPSNSCKVFIDASSGRIDGRLESTGQFLEHMNS